MLKYAMPFVITLMAGISTPALAQSFNHQAWDEIVKENVKSIGAGATNFDYANVQSKQEQLQAYLDQLSAIDQATFDGWSTDEQLAFLINAYNAFTVDLILSKYPDLTSINELGSGLTKPWQIEFVPLLGQTVTLDNIEHDMIRGSGRYNEPRIHFAVNCASIGCPPLINEAFTGDEIDAQLEKATQDFLTDRNRNFINGEVVTVSKIFDWYRDDFETGWRDTIDLGEFLALYSDSLGLNAEQSEALAAGDYDIEFSEYDWRLNDVIVPEGEADSGIPITWILADSRVQAGLALLILFGLLGGWYLVKRRKSA